MIFRTFTKSKILRISKRGGGLQSSLKEIRRMALFLEGKYTVLKWCDKNSKSFPLVPK